MTESPKKSNDVISLIQSRAINQSKPGRRDDKYKLGLVIEGGAMRGVVAGGMAAALEALDLIDAFDLIIGSSAGALTGAYLISEQARFGTSAYYENLNNQNFFNARRFLSRKPAVSLDFVFDQVIAHEKPLNYDKVINAKVPFVIVASSVDALEARYITNFDSIEDLKAALRASAGIPVLSGPPQVFRGERLWDATIYESVPYFGAIDHDCTHLLVLLTRPRQLRRAKQRTFERLVLNRSVRKYGLELEYAYKNRWRRYHNIIRQITDEAPIVNEKNGRVRIVEPKTYQDTVGSLEMNAEELLKGALNGVKSLTESFGIPIPQNVDSLESCLEQIPSIAKTDNFEFVGDKWN